MPPPLPRIVDHTHTMGPDSPGYLPDDALVMTPHGDLGAAGWQDYKLSLAEHFGTHLDAPSHFGGPAGLTVDRIPPDRLVGRAVVVDVRARVAGDDDYRLTVGDLHGWEDRHGRIPERAIVVMCSGWHTRWPDAAAYKNQRDGVHHFPGFSSDAVRWLLDHRDVNGIGVDTLSIDHGPSADHPVHRLLLGAGKWALENLTDLDRVPGSGGVMVVGPIKHRGGSGGPARVYTLLER